MAETTEGEVPVGEKLSAKGSIAGEGETTVDEENEEEKESIPPSRLDSLTSEESVKETKSNQNIEEDDEPVERPGDWRNMRRIIAEDPEWSLATVPLLNELVVKHIVKNFESNSKILEDLLTKHQKKVLEKISTDTPLKITALLVDDEGFWERCCKARWEICDVSAYGNCWKRMYMEKNLQQIIELYVPETTDPTQLEETLALSGQFVKRLDIRQLLPPVREEPKGPDFDDVSETGSDAGDEPECDHFNFGPILKKLPNLEELHLAFSVKDCGMNFEWKLFQFTARDCLQLSQAVASFKTLKVLRIHRSKVDDDKTRVLISHILDHPGLTQLDLSHNIIGDRGARAIGKFLNNHSQISILNLNDNQIHTPGAQAIAHALSKNTYLKELNIGLNRLGDEGGQAICRALLKNKSVVNLWISANDLAEPSASLLSQVMVQNQVLRRVDISCNRLGPDGGKQLQEGIEENTTVIVLDLRLTECGQESEYVINGILQRNRETNRNALIKENKQVNSVYVKSKVEPQACHRYILPPAAIIS